MKVAFIYSTKKISGLLTKFFTDSYCYHVGFVDETTDTFYDMNLLRRKRLWSEYSFGKEYVLADCPVSISKNFLEYKLATDNNTYGWKDYILFGLRPIFHLFGYSTRNAGGVICSEMVYNDLKECGWPKLFVEVPSPADLEGVLL
jgi:hypothetical protein